MTIEKKDLLENKASLQLQLQNALNTVEQAKGAIELVNFLLAKLPEDSLPVQDILPVEEPKKPSKKSAKK